MRTRTLVGLAVVQVVAVAGLYLFFVRTETGQRIEGSTAEGKGVLPGSWLAVVEDVLDVSVLICLALLAIAAVTAVARRDRTGGVAALVMVVGSNLTAQVLKRVLTRPLYDPDLIGPYSGYDDVVPTSLPSGHTTLAFSATLALALVVPRYRRPIALAGAGFAVVAGLLTLDAGWHRLSDVAAALLVVGAWLCVALAVTRLRTTGEQALLA